MAITYNESDLAAVGKIQESQGCTIAKAKEIFRKQVQKLANPDVEGRAQLVLDAIERGVEVASDEEVEETVSKKKAPKARKQKPAAKKSKSKKLRKATTPRTVQPLPELSREVELIPVAETLSVYTANLFGKKHVVVWTERDHGTGVAARFQTIAISGKQIDAAKKYGKENDLPLALCVTVRVNGRLDQGYAVPFKLFDEHRQRSKKNNLLTLSGAARKAYSEGGWDGVKFSERSAEKAA